MRLLETSVHEIGFNPKNRRFRSHVFDHVGSNPGFRAAGCTTKIDFGETGIGAGSLSSALPSLRLPSPPGRSTAMSHTPVPVAGSHSSIFRLRSMRSPVLSTQPTPGPRRSAPRSMAKLLARQMEAGSTGGAIGSATGLIARSSLADAPTTHAPVTIRLLTISPITPGSIVNHAKTTI